MLPILFLLCRINLSFFNQCCFSIRRASVINYTISRLEVVILTVFSIVVPTADNYSDLRLSYIFLSGAYGTVANITKYYNHTSDAWQTFKFEPVPQYKYSIFTILPVLVLFVFTIKHWWTKENASYKRWRTLPLLILQIWPQSRVCRILYYLWKGNTKWVAEKLYFDSELSTIGKHDI